MSSEEDEGLTPHNIGCSAKWEIEGLTTFLRILVEVTLARVTTEDWD